MCLVQEMTPRQVRVLRTFHHIDAHSPQSVKTERDYEVKELLCMTTFPCIEKPKGREGQVGPEVTGYAQLMPKKACIDARRDQVFGPLGHLTEVTVYAPGDVESRGSLPDLL